MYTIKRKIENGKWTREFDFSFTTRVFFTITTNKYVIQITGGSVIIRDKNLGDKLAAIKGYNYLYTGDVNPSETEQFVLENGKHFYVISLDDFKQKLRVTLPRTYESIDVYGSFSEDGKSLYIPVHKYDDGYEYMLCEYETENYSLVSKKKVTRKEVTHWP